MCVVELILSIYICVIGGGVFGNDMSWITHAIGRALAILDFNGANLNVIICHHRSKNQSIVDSVEASYERELALLKGVDPDSSKRPRL